MESVVINFAKNHKDTIIPSKRDEDGGFDIYARFDDDFIIINPHQTVMIPTDLCSAFPPGYVFILKERGSTGTKGMAQRCGIIDSGFRSPWFVPITNTTDRCIVIAKKSALDSGYPFLDTATIYPYEKAICQAILFEIPRTVVTEVPMDKLLEIKSDRMGGQLGSSGK